LIIGSSLLKLAKKSFVWNSSGQSEEVLCLVILNNSQVARLFSEPVLSIRRFFTLFSMTKGGGLRMMRRSY
jgi:hypothetical protein